MINSFSELSLSAPILKAIEDLNYTSPSPIQAQALPILLGEETDFLGLAATGTGKTAAFSIPLLEKIDTNARNVQALIMCPTRELALQVAGQIDLLGKHLGIKALPVYGGSSFGDQVYGLKRGATIVVGTPGRIVDHMDRGTLKLDGVKTVVLDEADEMISMGFKEDMEKILQATPRDESRVWLFSATMSREIRKVADTYLREPKMAQVNKTEMLSSSIEQLYYFCRESDKPEILCKLIEAADDFYGIVFCQTKALVIDLTRYLTDRGYKVDCLHGDKDQTSREKTMNAFRSRKMNILVCTDVASRGIDVKDITHVINYSIPRELDAYVHRIGRTARSGKSGIAMSLVTQSHRPLIGRIEKMTKSRMTEGRIPSRRDIAQKRVNKLMAQFLEQKSFERASEIMGEEWSKIANNMTSTEIIGRFLTMIASDLFVDRESKHKVIEPTEERRESRSSRRPEHRSSGSGGGFRESRRDSRGSSGERNEERSKRGDRFRRQAGSAFHLKRPKRRVEHSNRYED